MGFVKERLFSDNNWEKGKKYIYFYRKSDILIYCIEMQKYSFERDNKRPYTFNLSFICPKIFEEYFQKKLINILPEKGIINLRPFELFKSINLKHREFWFVEEINEDKHELINIFQNYVFNLFYTINTYEDLYKYITDNKFNLSGAQQEQFIILKNNVKI